jgi:hypothetical protein
MRHLLRVQQMGWVLPLLVDLWVAEQRQVSRQASAEQLRPGVRSQQSSSNAARRADVEPPRQRWQDDRKEARPTRLATQDRAEGGMERLGERDPGRDDHEMKLRSPVSRNGVTGWLLSVHRKPSPRPMPTSKLL